MWQVWAELLVFSFQLFVNFCLSLLIWHFIITECLGILPTRNDLLDLMLLPLVKQQHFDNCLSELPGYVTLATGFNFTSDVISERCAEVRRFWESHATELPNFYFVFQIVSLLNPSAAPAERLFSLHDRIARMLFPSCSLIMSYFLECHPGSLLLEETLEASVLLPFNGFSVRKSMMYFSTLLNIYLLELSNRPVQCSPSSALSVAAPKPTCPTPTKNLNISHRNDSGPVIDLGTLIILLVFLSRM